MRAALVHGGLFVATFLSAFHAQWGPRAAIGAPDATATGLAFAVTLMSILLAHEMGHFVLARIHKVDASLPYFIPLPFGLIGTLGAVIRMRSPVRSRDALVDIGAAGPLAGLVVAFPLLAYGLSISEVRPIEPGGLLEGNSLAYLGLKYLVTGAILPGGGLDVYLHPVAFAAWVGLLVTMINLLPIGQLDGGHIAYGYFGPRHDRSSALLHKTLVPIGVAVLAWVWWDARDREHALAEGVQAALPWFVWPLMIQLMRRLSGGAYHPPVGEEPLSPGRRRLCYLVAVVFLLILTPIPFRATLP